MRYFIAIAEERSFSRAAERLHISQPPLSRQVQDLESELGCQLFIRSANKIELTEAGVVYLEQARATITQAAWAARLTQMVAAGEAGELRVGYVPVGLHTREALGIVSAFRRAYPKVMLRLVHMSAADQMQALAERKIDVAICHTLNDAPPGVSQRVLCRDETVFAIPPGHKLLKKRTLMLSDLADEEFIAPARNTDPEFHDQLSRSWEIRGFRPKVVIHADSFVTMLALVAAGTGIAFAGRRAAGFLKLGVHLRQAQDFLFDSGAELRWLSDAPSPLVQRFTDLAAAAA